ncbi:MULTISPECIES: SdrD B-like domain-containing protein [unclassified Frigoribacterium]|uniref:SdrD B-like domain-containing protein n=1 Tax=unclassified Frigoribacterium TaxID=2627005 RepID=UPI00070113FA|nr:MULTISPECIES: SdrD B-like domain-containing protein [unclassified Frigoribacterium]KQO46352.1 hypothetical protein ASF07_00870 [Frigoribacterium sp. Leaf254]KQT38445.1 hypothetical protein ASG28_00870 [Frigoribacterium sp. Leaf415]
MKTTTGIRGVGATVALAMVAAAFAATPAAATPAATASASTSPAAPASAATSPAAPASAATVDLEIERRADGSGPFTPAEGPGADASASNGIVRTFDAITYRVTVSANGGSVTNERFTVTAPAGTTWAGLPNTCQADGSAIVGPELTCNVGMVGEGQVLATPVVLTVDSQAGGGTVAITGTVTGDDVADPAGPVTSVPTTVSAAPRFDLSKSVANSNFHPGVVGPDGTEGTVIQYPVAVAWEPVVPGQGLLGYERSAGTFTFQDDVSRMFGDLPSPAVLFGHDGGAACGLNDGRTFPVLPGGSGGRSTAVLHSGRFECTQSAPGQPVDVTITGTDTDITPSRGIPSQSATGQPIQGGVKPYVISGYVSIWVPGLDAGQSLIATNTYTPLQTTGISGASNFPGSAEPLTNNSVDRNLSYFVPGGGFKHLGQTRADGSTAVGSAKSGDPYVTPGTRIRSQVNLANKGVSDYVGAIACDVYDNRFQKLTTLFGNHAATNGWNDGVRVEYAAFSFTDPSVGRDATCDDSDGPWYDSPEDVPGGVDAIGKIRAVGTVAGGRAGNLFSYFEVQAAPNDTRIYDFGSIFDGTSAWVHDTAPAVNGAGPLADSVIVTQVRARIVKKIVDPGTSAATTPDKTAFVVAGTSVDYALYPTLTNATEGGRPQVLTVTDVLPPHTTYQRGSSSLEPTSVETTTIDGEVHEKIVWTLEDVVPNRPIAALTYRLDVSGTAPAGSVSNTARVFSEDDLSPEERRTALRGVRVESSSGIGVQKTAKEPVVVVGDALVWALEYRNTDAVPIAAVDLIDVLPSVGPGGEQVDLAAPVSVGPAAGERVSYTTAAPGSISLDGNDASNATGGATAWFDGSRIGTGGDEVALEDVTAVRIQRTTAVDVGEVVTHDLTATTTEARDGDVVTNRFGLRATNLALPAFSNRAAITVVAGAVGDHVWDDTDADGLQGPAESGIPSVPVTLTGTDDRGHQVERHTTTDIAGTYAFDRLRPGAYTVAFSSLPDRAWTARHQGDDDTVDSDAGVDGTATVALSTVLEGDELVGVDRDLSIDAGLLSAVVPEEPVDPGTPVDPDMPLDPEAPVGAVGAEGTTSIPSTGPRALGGDRLLAFTGAEPALLGLGGLGLLVLGALVALAALRRRDS